MHIKFAFDDRVLAGESKDALFGQFFSALERSLYFKTLPDGNDDPVRLDKATNLFHDALAVCSLSLSLSIKINPRNLSSSSS